jgi:hypothetical protein
VVVAIHLGAVVVHVVKFAFINQATQNIHWNGANTLIKVHDNAKYIKQGLKAVEHIQWLDTYNVIYGVFLGADII